MRIRLDSSTYADADFIREKNSNDLQVDVYEIDLRLRRWVHWAIAGIQWQQDQRRPLLHVVGSAASHKEAPDGGPHSNENQSSQENAFRN